MDVLDEVLPRFWGSLNNHDVKYIMLVDLLLDFMV